MPYTLDSPDLPENVKNLPTRKRRQWVAVWNSAFDKCQKKNGIECEAVAYRSANGVLKMREASDNPDDYLIVEDPEKKTTWHLQVKDGGTPNHRLMGGAWAALHGGYRGNKYEGPGKAEAIRKLKSLYKDEDMATPAETEEVAESGMEFIPPGVTSFADLQAAQEVYETAEQMQERVMQFQALASNILWSAEITDKISALRALVDEFASLMSGGGSSSMADNAELAEAATIKARARGALKSLSALLEDKSLPDSLRGKIEELRGALRKNWKDLEAEAKDEWGKKGEAKPEDEEEATAELAECQLSESEAGAALLVEADGNAADLVRMDVRLIRPGWGNTKDNHFYAQETLSQAAERFANAKMYETDHRASEKSTRTWVSTIESAKAASDGSLVGKVVVHDPSFAARIRNLAAAGHLDLMECSILADGLARAGYQEGGRKGKYIESITRVDSVDWVTRAGAGGAALNLSESEQGNQAMEESTNSISSTSNPDGVTISVVEPVTAVAENTTPVFVQEAAPEPAAPVLPVVLPVERVSEILTGTRLPKPAQARLSAQAWADETALAEAVENEIAYLKEITGSGKPFGLGESAAAQPARMSETDRLSALDEIDRRYGLKR